jgi:H+/Cl- antiporter ClcA
VKELGDFTTTLVVGALIVGVMVRYGSERIRGHGIPEAIDAILIIASRPRLKRRGDKLILVTVRTNRSC